jgi:hypothetical protein
LIINSLARGFGLRSGERDKVRGAYNYAELLLERCKIGNGGRIIWTRWPRIPKISSIQWAI